LSGCLGSLSTAAIGLPSIMLFNAGGKIRPLLRVEASLLDILAILVSASTIDKYEGLPRPILLKSCRRG
jgi:hypothetical protein